MTSLLERRVVRCPRTLAQQYLSESLGCVDDKQQPCEVRFRASFGTMEVGRNLVITVCRADDSTSLYHGWGVRWAHQNGGPQPEFDGELSVLPGTTWDVSILELRGVYQPPGAAFAMTFDAETGNTIARASAVFFLDELALTIERAARYAS